MCGPLCCVLHGLWGFLYIAGGSVQLVAGIFFLLSLPVFRVGSNIWTGACNVLIGVLTFLLCCFGVITKSRTQGLLYLTFIALGVNIINLTVLEAGEWWLFKTKEIRETIERKNLHDLAHYARLSTSITTGIVILIALVDSQITYCTLQFMRKSFLVNKGVNETVSDIEYIIPRNKSRSISSNKAQSVNNFTQSWVFDAETGACSLAESPAITMYPSAPVETHPEKGCDPRLEYYHYSSTPVVRGNAGIVTVQVDDLTKEGSNGDRQINHMKSFSRTPSPAEASHSSSSSSIPPFYECLERLTQPTVYRSRLSSYKNLKDVSGTPGVRSRVQSGDKEHYASLMVELESSFCHKKEPKTTVCAVPPGSASKLSTSYSTWNESVAESVDSRQRGSDAEFSKELEAALKLIQDLESPNTIDTPSETCKFAGEDRKRRKSRDDKNDSDSTKTLSGSSSLETHGKNHKTLPVESQSTSGYNSPSLDRSSRLTPTAGLSSCDLTASQENGLSCVIRHLGDTAVISLFSPTKEPHPYSSADKVSDIGFNEKEYLNENDYDKRTKSLIELKIKNVDGEEKYARGKVRKWRHFIERKRRPSLLPEVESAIMKSESLAFLSKRELKDRLNQTKSIHRKIEQKVHRQRSLRKADSFGSVEDIIDRYGMSTCL